MIWFTSDLHLGHRAAINMCERPFENVQQMNQILIRNFNSCVKKNDTVYILGDVSHRMHVAEVNQLIHKMNGRKILCKGNHDKKYDAALFEGIYDFLEIAIHGVNVSLMHYPMMNRKYRGKKSEKELMLNMMIPLDITLITVFFTVKPVVNEMELVILLIGMTAFLAIFLTINILHVNEEIYFIEDFMELVFPTLHKDAVHKNIIE